MAEKVVESLSSILQLAETLPVVGDLEQEAPYAGFPCQAKGVAPLHVDQREVGRVLLQQNARSVQSAAQQDDVGSGRGAVCLHA